MADLSDNPRFANYARAHRRSPADQLEADRLAWPGGIMAGFTTWNSARLAEYGKVNPSAFTFGGLTDHAAYDAWLTAWVDASIGQVRPPDVTVAAALDLLAGVDFSQHYPGVYDRIPWDALEAVAKGEAIPGASPDRRPFVEQSDPRGYTDITVPIYTDPDPDAESDTFFRFSLSNTGDPSYGVLIVKGMDAGEVRLAPDAAAIIRQQLAGA